MKPHPFLPLVFSLCFLGGCLAVRLIPPNSPLVDRPWLQKPAPLREYAPVPPVAAMRALAMPVITRTNHQVIPTKNVSGTYVEPTGIKGLTVRFEGKTNLLGTNWLILTNYPYPMAGGILYFTNAFTNFPALYVRECYVWPK